MIRATPLLALRYMTRFRCLGGECEDTCCRRWNVTIDEAHFHGLREAMSAPVDRSRFLATFIEKPAAERSAWAFATIRMRDGDGCCPMLEDDRTCGVHARFGEAALPDVCAHYPRFVMDAGDRLELAGSMSCPEVARLALLSEDGLDLVEVDDSARESPEGSMIGRGVVVQRPTPEQLPHVDELRGLAWMLLDGSGGLAARLYHLAWLAGELTPLLASGELSEEDVEAATDPGVLEELSADLGAAAPSSEGLGVLLGQIGRLRSVVRPELQTRLKSVVEFAAERALFETSGERLVWSDGFGGALAKRRAEIGDALEGALDEWLGRYAKDFVFRDLARPGATLESTVRELIVRIATWKILGLMAPGVVAGEAGMAALGAWMIELIHGISRVADHDLEVRTFLGCDAEESLTSLSAMRGLLALV